MEAKPLDHLGTALTEIARRPLKTLVPPWSWKSALFSAIVRGATFYVSNLQAGVEHAFVALAVEASYAIVAAGLIGAVSQQLRAARPIWLTFLVVTLGLPGAMVGAQAIVHKLAHTQHVGLGLLTSFALAAVSNLFSWFAMRRGAMLGGADSTTFRHDLESLPRIFLDFLIAGPRMLFGKVLDHFS